MGREILWLSGENTFCHIDVSGTLKSYTVKLHFSVKSYYLWVPLSTAGLLNTQNLCVLILPEISCLLLPKLLSISRAQLDI